MFWTLKEMKKSVRMVMMMIGKIWSVRAWKGTLDLQNNKKEVTWRRRLSASALQCSSQSWVILDLRACKLSVMVAGGWKRSHPFLWSVCLVILDGNRTLVSLYMGYPNCPATCYIYRGDLLSFFRFFCLFTFFLLIFRLLVACLGSKKDVSGVICPFGHVVYAAG